MRLVKTLVMFGALFAFGSTVAGAAIIVNETDMTDIEFKNKTVQPGVVVLCEFGIKMVGKVTICSEDPKDDNAVRIGDVINFFNVGGKGQVSMNSDSEDTEKNQPMLDDTKVMLAVFQNAFDKKLPIIFLPELAKNPYTAEAGQPGYDTKNEANVDYEFISDVPEPSTWMLLGVGLIAMSVVGSVGWVRSRGDRPIRRYLHI